MHSFPFRLVSLIWHPFLNLLLSLFNVFFCFVFNLPLPVRFLSHFLICVFSILCLFHFFFCKNISTTICWVVSGNCFILFCYVCVFVFFFTVSTSSMALFAQHQSLLFSISWLRVCVWVRIFFPPFHILLCHIRFVSLFTVCLKTAAYVLKDIHNFPHLIFS